MRKLIVVALIALTSILTGCEKSWDKKIETITAPWKQLPDGKAKDDARLAALQELRHIESNECYAAKTSGGGHEAQRDCTMAFSLRPWPQWKRSGIDRLSPSLSPPNLAGKKKKNYKRYLTQEASAPLTFA
jgi:hypothetical protein